MVTVQSLPEPLTSREQQYHHLVDQVKCKLERVLGSIKRWWVVTVYVGLVKTHDQHVLETIVDNLIQTPVDDDV